MCAVVVTVDVEDSDGTLVAHALLGDTDDLLIVVRKRDALDGRRELLIRRGTCPSVDADQSRISLSAEPETRNRDCATRALAKSRWAKDEVIPGDGEKHAQSTSIVQTVPLCPL